MDASDGTAAPVAAILRSARDRKLPDRRRVDVDARSLPVAVAAAEADGRVPVIAEVKPTSPTTDSVWTEDPVGLAEDMVAGGAAAISVLTEPVHFGGSTEMLSRVRDAVEVPVLRKDFILDERHLDAVEADIVLLIVRFLDDLEGLLEAAHDRGFQALVEVHTRGELEVAVDAGAEIIGINNRDLGALNVDLGTFERVAPVAPTDRLIVAESGIDGPGDARRMREAGADALLIGSAIMRGPVRDRTTALVEAER